MRHLLDFQGWTKAQVENTLDTARVMAEVLERPVKKVPALQGFTVATVFFEPSTRTRISFELAARRMSADVVSFAAQASSLQKGESYKDTLLTLEAMGIDAYIIRADSAGVPHQATRWVKGVVVNGGDGRRAHPTQALLDAYTLLEALGTLEGRKIAIVGDILHSRVARSNVELLPLLGAEVWVAGPPTLLPQSLPGARLTPHLDEALAEADAVMVLRLQKERMEAGLIHLQDYIAHYQVTEARLKKAKPGAFLLHPGPMNRDIELEGTLADSERSLVNRQVRNGVAVRMAVLYHLLVGRER
ncbi:aspartate carbamoyltransferase catalytic subunit [Thermus scotoductus]|uniref:Aspartate carbamoyltransferase n=1 Tax=Thermus scotoductus TaxID=37636 RepID=A0A430R1M1_THESC|nr:aspartate carbamoyltransferase catalytic subunit [Thermus scotoductus]RTG98503.1 aspartate carbamoyltransferase [Thermus scotoductus]RTH01298.1 aspartate carbamoyltransferase [Thermus scotoductus]RTH23352.1 aspartate carbamoyltransferase [Thermus scotoductus]RTI02803.1 aspartate carbamoyltransferase [Thermus scotoductus]RTI24952.1 aspartate carbamoyltransferase [Thermus scotoductus]